MHAVLTPAYGNDYKNQKEVKAAWEGNKDFILCSYRGTTYINKSDAANSDYTEFNIRYDNKRKVVVIKNKK